MSSLRTPSEVWTIDSPKWEGRKGVLWVVILFVIGFAVLWITAHEISDLRNVRYPLYFEWEVTIPFQHWALWVYLPHDVIIILAAVMFRNWREAIPFYGTMLAQIAIAFPFFVLVPIEPGYQNEMATGVWGTYGFEMIGMKNISQWNHMPSLHVSYVFILGTVIGQRYGVWGWIFGMLWAVIVSASTMLVHEHHVICVVGGLLLYVLTLCTVYPWLKRKCGLGTDGRDPSLLENSSGS